MDLGLVGKTALVTGGTTGIGFAIAEVMVQEGARVIVASRQQKNVETAVGQLRALKPGAKVDGVSLDLLQEAQARTVVADLLKHSTIDILINNVGGPAAGPVLKLTLEDWDRGYQSLLRSVILMSQLVVPGMKKNQWGRIVTVTSTAARELIPGLPVSATFRAGLSAFTKALSREVGDSGILVNNLLPGPTQTARLAELEVKNPVFFNSMATETAVKRVAQPDEIARVAAFICSAANTYLTGTDVLVDGGYTKSL